MQCCSESEQHSSQGDEQTHSATCIWYAITSLIDWWSNQHQNIQATDSPDVWSITSKIQHSFNWPSIDTHTPWRLLSHWVIRHQSVSCSGHASVNCHTVIFTGWPRQHTSGTNFMTGAVYKSTGGQLCHFLWLSTKSRDCKCPATAQKTISHGWPFML